MQDNRYVCSDCGAHLDQRQFSTEEAWNDAKQEHLNHSTSVKLLPEFGDLLFKPGPGHIELNMG